MRIKWLGHAAFLLTGESTQVVIDPYGRIPAGRGMKFAYPPLQGLEAELVLVSHEHVDHNGIDAVGGEPKVLRTAGTFESPAGEVVGVASEHDPQAGARRGANTIFCFTLDGLRCCHLGDFGQSALRPEQREAIGKVDALLLPVGGGPTIDGEQAANIVSELRPKVAIPMHFATDAVNFLEPPDRFLAAVSARVERPGTSEIEPRRFMDSGEEPIVVLLDPAVVGE
jgi:L-ascorbate metabolism protein UlaG (beta-lactamase superfamily)